MLDSSTPSSSARTLLTHGCTRAQATVAFDNLPKEWAGIFPEHFSFTCCGIGFMLTLLLERVVLADGDDASGKKQNLKDSGRRFALNLTCIRLVCMCMYALYDQRAMHSRTHTSRSLPLPPSHPLARAHLKLRA